MELGALNERMTDLLKGQSVKWVRQDHPNQLTVQFDNGPVFYIDASPTNGELDISIVAGPEASPEWIALADGTSTQDGKGPQ